MAARTGRQTIRYDKAVFALAAAHIVPHQLHHFVVAFQIELHVWYVAG